MTESGGGSTLVPPVADQARQKTRTTSPAPGLTFPRFFTEAGVDPFDEI